MVIYDLVVMGYNTEKPRGSRSYMLAQETMRASDGKPERLPEAAASGKNSLYNMVCKVYLVCV